MNDSNVSVRLDKWLWAARFYKTRALAKAAVEGGKVHYNKAKAKPSRSVELGVTLRLQLGWDEKTIVVKGLTDKRRSAPDAQQLYVETDESILKREAMAQQRKTMNLGASHSEHRPNKKQRRDIIRFKSSSTD